MTREISLASVVSASAAQVSTELGDETVILSLQQGVYYGLEGVGRRVWGLLQQPRRVGALVDILLEEYEVAPATLEQDVLALLREMAAQHLVAVDGESTR